MRPLSCRLKTSRPFHFEDDTMILTDSGNGNFEQAPIGTHRAVCTKLIDIGTQRGEYQGQVSMKRQLILGWELVDELMTTGEYAGKPFTVSKFYTASLNEKATLRHDLANWRGLDFSEEELRGFDAKNILGAGCLLSLVMNDKQRVKVNGVMALPKANRDSMPKPVAALLYFSLEPDQFDQSVFDSLSDGYKKMITVSPEYQQLKANPAIAQSGDDFEEFPSDIPF